MWEEYKKTSEGENKKDDLVLKISNISSSINSESSYSEIEQAARELESIIEIYGKKKGMEALSVEAWKVIEELAVLQKEVRG